MFNFAKVFGLVGDIVPLVIDTVTSIEHFFGPGNGSTKKTAVTNAVTDALNIFNTATGASVGGNSFTSALGDLIDAIVAFNNATGIFNKSNNSTPTKG